MKNKKINSEKVKAILKKGIDVFCYVVTALAITLGIAVGVNKCSSSAATQAVAADLMELSQPSNSTVIRKRAVSAEDYFVYISKYTGVVSVDFDSIRSVCSVPTSLSPTQRSALNYYFFADSDSYWLTGSNYFGLKYVSFHFVDFPLSSTTPNQYEYKLEAVFFVSTDDNPVWSTIYNRTNEYATGEESGNFRSVKIVFTNEEIQDTAFLAFFEKGEKSSFTFNEGFNYNAPFNLNVNAVYGSTSFDGGSDGLKYKDYDTGWFISNGQLFNRIRWWAINSAGVSVMIGGNVSTLTSDIDWVYTFMYYVNTDTGNEVLVNQRDSIPYNGGNSRYYANSTTWIVPSYRNIVFLTELSNTLRDSLESFNNNNQTTYGGGVVSSEVNDVFSLIASAFSGLLPILTLAILPNVTIGTLLFVPLVAMLVFAIIRIIKK